MSDHEFLGSVFGKLTDDDIITIRDADARAMGRLGIGKYSLP